MTKEALTSPESANEAITNNNPETADASFDHLSKEEAKKILTPSAFRVNPLLFGAPLATPSKRAFALLVDFILIGILSDAPGELLAILIALTFIQLGSKKRAQLQGKKRGARKKFMLFVGIATLAIVLLSVASDMFFPDEATASTNNNETTISTVQGEEKANETTKDSDNSKEDGLLVTGLAWLKDSIKELGLSFGWAALYFTLATAVLNGQTLGKRIFSIRVLQLDGTPLSVWDSFGRYGGYAAGLATGFLGFLQVFWDPNRQAIHDRISSTIVIDVKLAQQQNHASRLAGLRAENSADT